MSDFQDFVIFTYMLSLIQFVNYLKNNIINLYFAIYRLQKRHWCERYDEDSDTNNCILILSSLLWILIPDLLKRYPVSLYTSKNKSEIRFFVYEDIIISFCSSKTCINVKKHRTSIEMYMRWFISNTHFPWETYYDRHLFYNP